MGRVGERESRERGGRALVEGGASGATPPRLHISPPSSDTDTEQQSEDFHKNIPVTKNYKNKT
jgi:hypothetical protein